MRVPDPIDLLVTGGHVLTMEADAPEIADGAIAIDRGRIHAVGARDDLVARFAARETLDARGCAVPLHGIRTPRSAAPAAPAAPRALRARSCGLFAGVVRAPGHRDGDW